MNCTTMIWLWSAFLPDAQSSCLAGTTGLKRGKTETKSGRTYAKDSGGLRYSNSMISVRQRWNTHGVQIAKRRTNENSGNCAHISFVRFGFQSVQDGKAGSVQGGKG